MDSVFIRIKVKKCLNLNYLHFKCMHFLFDQNPSQINQNVIFTQYFELNYYVNRTKYSNQSDFKLD